MSLYTGDVYQTAALPGNLKATATMLSHGDRSWRSEGLIPGIQYRIYAADRHADTTGSTEAFVGSRGRDPMVIEIQLEERP